MTRACSCFDHLGNAFETKSAMCRAYGITMNILYRRISRGWTLERTLTTPRQEQPANIRKAVEHRYKIPGGTVTVREHYR